ncbi:MAG: hypothetical protein ABJB16_08910 [Saprospiraceae bacterium]
MKITLILASFAFFSNAFGQGKGPSFSGHSSASHSSPDTYLKLQNIDGILSKKLDFDKLCFKDKHQSCLLLDPFQLMDSGCYWRWDKQGIYGAMM